MHTGIESYNKKNKLEIAKLMAIIYHPDHAIPNYIQKMIVTRLLWATTENDDEGEYKKYVGQPYWSVGALHKLMENLEEKQKTPKINPFYDLRHEHAVPKKEIYRLIDASDKTEGSIFALLDTLGHSVVVSKEEDYGLNEQKLRDRMPEGSIYAPTLEYVFSRYIQAKIHVCDVRMIPDIMRLSIQEIVELEKSALT